MTTPRRFTAMVDRPPGPQLQPITANGLPIDKLQAGYPRGRAADLTLENDLSEESCGQLVRDTASWIPNSS